MHIESRRGFLAIALIGAVFRAWFAWRLPITGDEAYFYYWGVNPDWGFYDHPPMVGWLLAGLSVLSHEPWVLRLPTLMLPLLLAWVAYRIVARSAPAAAWSAASLVLLAPLNVWNVAITTDIPLVAFAALTVLAYLRALDSGRARDYALCGLMLGGALMSKYFAGILALALATHLLSRPSATRLRGLALIVLCSLPAAFVQIAWNAQNCWPNLMFNLVNRHEGAGLSWRTPLLYLVTVAYVVTPWVMIGLLRRAGGAGVAGRSNGSNGSGGANGASGVVSGSLREQSRALTWIALFAFALFGALSLVKTIGLHWLASFVLPAVLWFALRAGARQRALALRLGIGFALLHMVAIAVLMSLPIETFQRWRSYPGLVMTLDPKGFAAAVEPYRGAAGKRMALASDGYSPAVTIGFNLNQYAFVFGPGSSHARHDDILNDLRKLAGKDVLIIRRDAGGGADDARYFERVVASSISVRGASFHLTQGYGFRYEAYRDAVLEQVRARYYAVPAWLPSGPCYLCDRYFPDRSCHR